MPSGTWLRHENLGQGNQNQRLRGGRTSLRGTASPPPPFTKLAHYLRVRRHWPNHQGPIYHRRTLNLQHSAAALPRSQPARPQRSGLDAPAPSIDAPHLHSAFHPPSPVGAFHVDRHLQFSRLTRSARSDLQLTESIQVVQLSRLSPLADILVPYIRHFFTCFDAIENDE